MHKESLSQTLFNNSQITGVKVVNCDQNLSSTAHGLYIKSLTGDCYADLRPCSEKPFWGYTHPLEVQDQFGQLIYDQNGPQLYVYPLTDVQNFISQKNVQTIDELDAIKEFPKLEAELVLLKNTILCQESFFPSCDSHNKTLLLEIWPYAMVISNKELLGLPKIESALIQKMYLYLDYLIWQDSGKMAKDRQIIAQASSNKVKSFGSYLFIPGKYEGEVMMRFFESGLVISDKNITSKGIYLCLPLSCTNDELLDTLNRVNIIAEEL